MSGRDRGGKSVTAQKTESEKSEKTPLTLLHFHRDYAILKVKRERSVVPMATIQTSLANTLDAVGTAA